MKKNYIQPELRIVFIKGTTILSGSSGNEIKTGESNATINVTNTDDYNGLIIPATSIYSDTDGKILTNKENIFDFVINSKIKQFYGKNDVKENLGKILPHHL